MLAIGSLTLVPAGRRPDSPGWCLFCGWFSAVDAVLNVLLFVPLGVGLGLMGVRARRALLIAGGLSVAIELLQLTVIPGRDATIRDVITNALGGGIGAWLACNARALLRAGWRRATGLVAGWGLAWVAVHVLAAWTMAPDFPDRLYYGQRQRVLEQFDVFPGRLLEGTVDGRELPDHADPGLARIRSVWRDSGVVRAQARVIAGASATRRIAPILSVFDEHRREILVFGQWGAGLAFRVESHAREARLRPLTFALPRVFPGVDASLVRPGDTVDVGAELRPGFARLTARRGTSARTVTLPLRPALAWTTVLPFELPVGPWTDAGSLLWLFASVLPAGYWSGLAARGNRRRAIAIVVVVAMLVAGLWLTPRLFALSGTPAPEWLAAVLGLLTGAAISRRVRCAEGGGHARSDARCPSGEPVPRL